MTATVERIDIYGTDGSVLPVTVPDWAKAVIASGGPGGMYGLPPVSFDEQASTQRRAGQRRGRAKHLSRPLFVPIVVSADDGTEAKSLVDQISRLLDPLWGDCRIVSTGADGSSRDIVATYTSGWQPNVSALHQGLVTADLTFRAHDPYWRSTSELNNSLIFPVSGTGASLTGWDDLGTLWDASGMPWDGFQATESAATARTDVVVSCTAPVWPRWEITGPGTRVELHNVAVSSTFVWEGNLPDGASMSVDFDEDRRHVRINGVNAWSGLSDSSEFWQLKPGNGPADPQRNPVLAQVVGSDSSTLCQMIYRPAFLSP